jgi:hypothetical protein
MTTERALQSPQSAVAISQLQASARALARKNTADVAIGAMFQTNSETINMTGASEKT